MFGRNAGEIQSSITKFERMLKTNLIYYFDPQEFEDIVVHYLGFGENQTAKKALNMGLEQHPSSIVLMLLQSEILILDEKYDLANSLLDHIEKSNPFDEEIALQKASIASKKGEHKLSIKYLHQALNFSDDPNEIWNLLGMEHLLAEEYEDASYFFKNCLENNHEDYPSLYNLLFCYEQLNQNELAISTLNSILENNPYCEVAWHQLGKIYSKIGKIKEAISALEFAIICDDSFTSAYIEKGKLLEKDGKINEALDNYNLALNTNEPSAFIYNCVGRCHESLGNYDLTNQFYLKSVKLEPNNEKCWKSLISFMINQNNFDKAEYYLKDAIDANSDAIDLWKYSIDLYITKGKKEDAIFACQKLFELGYFNPEIVIKLVDYLIENKSWKSAYNILNDNTKLIENNRDIEIRIAGCCFQLGKIKEGKYLLNLKELNSNRKNQFNRLFPDFRDLSSSID